MCVCVCVCVRVCACALQAISPPERRIGSQTVDPRAMRTTKESAPVEEFSPLAVPVLTHEELAPLQVRNSLRFL